MMEEGVNMIKELIKIKENNKIVYFAMKMILRCFWKDIFTQLEDKIF